MLWNSFLPTTWCVAKSLKVEGSWAHLKHLQLHLRNLKVRKDSSLMDGQSSCKKTHDWKYLFHDIKSLKAMNDTPKNRVQSI